MPTKIRLFKFSIRKVTLEGVSNFKAGSRSTTFLVFVAEVVVPVARRQESVTTTAECLSLSENRKQGLKSTSIVKSVSDIFDFADSSTASIFEA